MTFLGKRLAIAIPDTVLEGQGSLREKTAKLGSVARSCATFGVDVVIVFKDPLGKGEPELVRKVLEYLETPQYLRKRQYSIDEDLKYAGLLPPLRTPSHKPRVQLEELHEGEIREGVTNADGTVDIGLDGAPMLGKRVAANRRVTVRIRSKNPLTADLVGTDDVKEYWGYKVESATVDQVLNDERFPLKIATSRLGDPLRYELARLRDSLGRSSRVLFLFGSPSRGLFDIVGPKLRERADFVVNLFGEQHVQTVRTEEAIPVALNLLNFLSM